MTQNLMLTELEKLFTIFNKKFFENKLETPMIVIAPSGKKRIMGYMTTNRVWKKINEEDGKGYYELCICAENVSTSFYELCDTMIHEMVHMQNIILEQKDCSGSYYHNKVFKNLAESLGLLVKHDARYGWGFTELSDELKQYVDTLDINKNVFDFNRLRLNSIKVKAPKQYTYTCPICKEKIKSINEKLYVMCCRCSEENQPTYFEIKQRKN